MKEFLRELNSYTENIWRDSGAWPDLISGMRQAVKIESASTTSEHVFPRWTLLPRLCCDSIGETPDGIIELTTAWLLLYAAADLMDSVQDHDDEESWWTEIGVGGALGIASGLYFSSSLALTRLEEKIRSANRGSIIAEIYRGFMYMCSGQLRDILVESPSLDEYWQIAAAKSGTFFRLGCQAAAMLSSADQYYHQVYSKIGTEIGLMIQIRDDLDDFRQLKEIDQNHHGLGIRGSLPLVYTMDVLPAAESTQLGALITGALIDQAASSQMIDIIDKSGAGIYILAELKRHGLTAIAALEEVHPREPAASELRGLINQLMGTVD